MTIGILPTCCRRGPTQAIWSSVCAVFTSHGRSTISLPTSWCSLRSESTNSNIVWLSLKIHTLLFAFAQALSVFRKLVFLTSVLAVSSTSTFLPLLVSFWRFFAVLSTCQTLPRPALHSHHPLPSSVLGHTTITTLHREVSGRG